MAVWALGGVGAISRISLGPIKTLVGDIPTACWCSLLVQLAGAASKDLLDGAICSNQVSFFSMLCRPFLCLLRGVIHLAQ